MIAILGVKTYFDVQSKISATIDSEIRATKATTDKVIEQFMKEKDASLTKLQTECDRIQQEADRASERRIWVKSLDDITASTDFEDFATITFETAKKLYGSDSDEAKAVGEARSKVGLSVYVREERSRTGKVGTGPRPSAKAGRNSNGEITRRRTTGFLAVLRRCGCQRHCCKDGEVFSHSQARSAEAPRSLRQSCSMPVALRNLFFSNTPSRGGNTRGGSSARIAIRAKSVVAALRRRPANLLSPSSSVMSKAALIPQASATPVSSTAALVWLACMPVSP